MRWIKKLILLLVAAGIVLAFGMVAFDWEIAGYSWKDTSQKLFPTKKIIEEKRNEYIKRAYEEAGPD